jgi:hypothetical protein
VPFDRSYESYEPGQELYTVIEFCNDPETQIESGKDQWLGVHPKGKFVLGRPPVQMFTASATVVKQPVGTDGDHRIEFRESRNPQLNQTWFATARRGTRCLRGVRRGRSDRPGGRVRALASAPDRGRQAGGRASDRASAAELPLSSVLAG